MTAPMPGRDDSGTPQAASVQVSDNTVSRSYDAMVDGKIAGTIVYERASKTRIVFTHTIVEPAFRGQGVGAALAKGALDDVRAKGLTLTNYCDFVGRYIQAHPEYADLIDAQHPGRVMDG
jgi:predicted GNAT family acetyltransferase